MILGIHSVGITSGGAQRNLDFYTGVLGLRLVKLTVCLEDPSAYQVSYGDAKGSPGTILTCVCQDRAPKGMGGVGMFMLITLAIPVGSTAFWRARLADCHVETLRNCHGETPLGIEDPDGLRISLIERPRVNPQAWTGGGIASSEAITGIDGVTLGSRTVASKKFTYETLGLPLRLESEMQSGNLLSRYEAGAQILDVMPTEHRSMAGRGTVHHVGFTVEDSRELETWHTRLKESRVAVGEVKPRLYYDELAFREPGGAVMSVVSPKPGFTLDEKSSELGSHLLVPPQLMDRAKELERVLPRLRLPVDVA